MVRKKKSVEPEVVEAEQPVEALPMNPLAQVSMVKTGLSALGERVPTVKEFESILRNAGCSRSVAKLIAYKVRNLEDEGDSGVMSGEPTRNAEQSDGAMRNAVDPEMERLAEVLNSLKTETELMPYWRRLAALK